MLITLLCFATVHSLFVRTYNDSSCTQSLPQYSISAPALNYSNDFGSTPLTHVCGSLPATSGWSANYSCGVTQPANGIAYFRMYVVNSSDCSVSSQSLQYYVQANGAFNASQSSCLPLHVVDFGTTPSRRVQGFAHWSCAIQPTSNSASAIGPSTGRALALPLSLVATAVALVTALTS